MKRKKTDALYASVYYDRITIGVKSYIPLVIQIVVALAGAALTLFALFPIIGIGPVLPVLSSPVFLGVGGAPFLLALGRMIFWFLCPKDIAAAEPGRIILFPGKKREIAIYDSQIINVRQHDFLGLRYRHYDITIYTKYNGRFKLHFVNESSLAMAKLQQLRRNKI